jgi:hypothetical protein
MRTFSPEVTKKYKPIAKTLSEINVKYRIIDDGSVDGMEIYFTNKIGRHSYFLLQIIKQTCVINWKAKKYIIKTNTTEACYDFAKTQNINEFHFQAINESFFIELEDQEYAPSAWGKIDSFSEREFINKELKKKKSNGIQIPLDSFMGATEKIIEIKIDAILGGFRKICEPGDFMLASVQDESVHKFFPWSPEIDHYSIFWKVSPIPIADPPDEFFYTQTTCFSTKDFKNSFSSNTDEKIILISGDEIEKIFFEIFHNDIKSL